MYVCNTEANNTEANTIYIACETSRLDENLKFI
jgi:hypothetical protein